MPRWKSRINTQARIGYALKGIRQRYGLTVKRVAQFIGCHQSSIYRLEAGEVGSLRLCEAYAWALGLDLHEVKFEGRGSNVHSLKGVRRVA